jgi:hypothetical protein
MSDSGFDRELLTVSEIESAAKAWKKFFTPEIIGGFHRIGMRPISGFNWRLDDLTLESDCSEEEALSQLLGMCCHSEHGELSFRRDRLCDKRGWLRLPLSYFVNTVSTAYVQIGVPKPIAVSVSSFRLKHQLTKFSNERWGRLYCVDPQIVEPGDEHQVAENRKFDRDATRELMFGQLLSKALEGCENSLVTFSADPLVDAVIMSNLKNATRRDP